MPSIINTKLTASSTSSELDFVADEAVYYSNNGSTNTTTTTTSHGSARPSSPSPSSQPNNLQDLKEISRRRWCDPDDE
ncbi:hypothetical protein BGZ99_001014, partial [Dissophora globulifera]